MSNSATYLNPANHPPTAFRPTNISSRPNSDGMIYVETAMPPPHTAVQNHGNTQNPNLSEVAGVLRRNQACLACRRRKLKCDAIRPHCSTCVRSHKHLMRTSSKSNPVLTCEYDDAPANEDHDRDGSMLSEDADDETDVRKKKRKANGEPKKKKKDEEDEETERLRKKIEALEAQLAKGSDGPDQPSSRSSTESSTRPWDSQQAYGDGGNRSSQYSGISAPSPTAFLEMLSSAASAQMPETGGTTGLRTGASSSAMMTGVPSWGGANDSSRDNGQQSSGLTPFLSYADSQAIDNASAQRTSNERQATGSTDSGSRRASQQPNNQSSFGMNLTSSPAVASVLSPNVVFNFSPGPSGPAAPGSQQTDSNWIPAPGPNGEIQPSTRTEGPWRSVETVDTVFQGASGNNDNNNNNTAQINADIDGYGSIGQGDVDMDGFPQVDEAMQQQLLMDLFWPGWPPNLPEPHIVNELVEAFFELVPNLNRLLHRARFLSRLALPPTHSNFPHPALIHAMCSSAAAWCAPSVYTRSASFKDLDTCGPGFIDRGTQSEKSMSFGLKQAAYGKDAVQDGLNTGNRLFDVVRAMIILSRVFIDDTRMLECWAYSGLVARMMLPLGLNVRSAELALKSVMLPPPADALEREERRAAVWMAFYHDTVASSASGWGTSISLDELSVPLPVSVKAFDTGADHMEPNPQDLESPDFWTKHPVQDSFVLVIKASVMLNRVNRFVRKWKNRHLREDDDLDGLQRPEFRELANAIACFQMSFPSSMRNPCRLNSRKRLDIDLIAAHMIPHAAIVCLYEPFADVTDPNDSAARRILGAAQSIVSVVQQLASVVNEGAQNFTSVMHSSASVCLVTAARTCLLFYRYALNMNDLHTAESHRMDIEMVRMALGQFGLRFKIGHHHSQLIEYFLDRATHPSLEKLQAHYPEHPRPGAPELHANAHLGACVLNALNVKRGFWRIPQGQTHSTGVSPYTSTPESAAYASSAAGQGQPSSSSSKSASATVNRVDSDSPRGVFGGVGYGGGDNPGIFKVPGDDKQRTPDSDAVRTFDNNGNVVDGQVKIFANQAAGGRANQAERQAMPSLTREMEKRFDSFLELSSSGQRKSFPGMSQGDSAIFAEAVGPRD